MSRLRPIGTALLATAFAAVALVAGARAAHAGGYCDEPVSDGRMVGVIAEKDCFTPSVVRVAVGQQLTFTNRDDMAHTVTGVGHQWAAELATGRSVAFKFSQPGTYPYFCHYHLGMVGAVVVGEGVATAASSSSSAVFVSPVPGDAPTTTSTPTSTSIPTAGLSGSRAVATRVPGPKRSTSPLPFILAAVAAGLVTLGFVVRRRPARAAEDELEPDPNPLPSS